MGANVLVEFENDFLIGGIFFQLGAIGGKCVSGIWKCFFNWGHFFPILGAIGEQMGPNVLVEFEKKILIGGIFFPNWGQLGAIGGKCVSGIWKCFLIGGIFFQFWGQMGANVLVELEKKDLIGVNWGQLGANVLVEFENVFLIGGNWGQLGANVLVEFKIFF